MSTPIEAMLTFPSLVLVAAACSPFAGAEGPRAEPAPAARAASAAEAVRIDAASLAGRSFEFSWRSADGGGRNGVATLRDDGTIEGIASPNESTWTVDAEGRLLFRHADGRVSTRYDRVWEEGGALRLEGPFLFVDGIVHSLAETGGSVAEPERRILPEQAARIQYSRQRFEYLDPGESCTFRMHDGGERTIRLESVEEARDAVVGLARRADVVVSIDGRRFALVCAPYAMPTETDGLRIQVDTTSAWLDLPKRVQLSLWDASDPIVDTSLFVFPLPGYRLLSHGTQAYGEPVHLGHLDGDPGGQVFYHDYGVDLAGHEGRQKVASAIDGTVVRADAEEGTLAVEDDRGLILIYGHLDSILSGIREGAAVTRGQWVGMLGRRGGSGNFSHLHVGACFTRPEAMAERMSKNLNLYPWLVTAWQARRGPRLLAVARPHRIARTGETVAFDGASSVPGAARIVSWEWEFPDGTRAAGPRAEKAFDEPGCHQVALRVEDERGSKDVDFATVRVYSRADPAPAVPTIFATFAPAEDARVGLPVSFRFWPQGGDVEPIRVDFGDGTELEGYVPYSAVAHVFREPGIHVVTVSGASEGRPVTQKLKVLVDR